jgi:hypothetical protein
VQEKQIDEEEEFLAGIKQTSSLAAVTEKMNQILKKSGLNTG